MTGFRERRSVSYEKGLLTSHQSGGRADVTEEFASRGGVEGAPTPPTPRAGLRTAQSHPVVCVLSGDSRRASSGFGVLPSEREVCMTEGPLSYHRVSIGGAYTGLEEGLL